LGALGEVAREQLRGRPRGHESEADPARPAARAAADQTEGGHGAERTPRPRHPTASGLRPQVGRGQGVLSAPEAQARRTRVRLDLTTPVLLGLPLAWLAVFFLVPIAIVGAYSVGRLSLDPGPHTVTLAAWHDFLHSPIYLKLFWKSVKMSLIVSVVVVALAYPLAYYLALSGTKRKYVLLLLLIAPFLTSYLLRVLAWKVILGNQGVINSFLFSTGLRSPDHPISQLLYSRFAVMLVLGYISLPFVALPFFAPPKTLARPLSRPAPARAASRWQTFRR